MADDFLGTHLLFDTPVALLLLLVVIWLFSVLVMSAFSRDERDTLPKTGAPEFPPHSIEPLCVPSHLDLREGPSCGQFPNSSRVTPSVD